MRTAEKRLENQLKWRFYDNQLDRGVYRCVFVVTPLEEGRKFRGELTDSKLKC